MSKKNLFRIVLLVVIILVAGFAGYRWASMEDDETSRGPVMEPTAVIVDEVRAIAQLSVLTCYKDMVVSREKKVPGILFDSKCRITVVYPCRMNLGVDLSELRNEDVQIDASTGRITVQLPPVRMLNKDGKVVDELARKSISDGDMKVWTAIDMKSLRDEAERHFLEQCKREGVYAKARQKVIDTVGEILQSLGYQNITILFPED